MRIRRLDPTLANQIAAGEVVERPASVLKEVLENSVDAGARRIEVDVERGGTRLVRVRDDGSGIHREDLVLALCRHATSKIRRFEDLRQIGSMGFRGEALPSIASVSRLTLVSRQAEEESGWSVEAAGSARVSDPVPAPHAAGTTVTVRDLFFNTPARRKFLRTEKTEFRHLEGMVKAFVLGHPELDVSLAHNGRQVFRLRAAASEREREDRVARVCGRRFVEHALRVEFGRGELGLRGWVAGPRTEPRASDPQYLFVNGRAVRDPVVRHAIRAGCAGWLGADRVPGHVLDLVLPAGDVDVNVHPAKHEVRFHDSRLVHDFVVRCLRELGGASLLPAESPAAADASPALRPEGRAAAGVEVAETRRPYGGGGHGGRRAEPAASVRGTAEDAPAPLGPLAGRYAAVAAQGGIRIFDVVAARREVLFERLRAAARAPVPSRPFLVPETHPVGVEEADRFEAHEESLLRLGFEFRRVGPDRIMLREAPLALAGIASPEIVAALAAALPWLASDDRPDRVPSFLRRLVERLEPPLDWPRVGSLLQEAEALGARSESPSGRIWVELEEDAIVSLFAGTRRK